MFLKFQDFQLDIYFQEKWEDRRLVHNNTKRILVKVYSMDQMKGSSKVFAILDRIFIYLLSNELK